MLCPCHFGLESVLSFEVKRIGGRNVTVRDGKVSFLGGWEHLARANYALATAERVMIELGRFPAHSFEELFVGVKALDWEAFIGVNNAFPVKGSSLNSQLHSVPDCQSIIKKAIVERLKTAYNTEWFEETGPVLQVRFTIFKDEVSVCLDSSGVGLHKRGYRQLSNEAPIKETLAAGMADLAHIRGEGIVCDPCCGSGTILIESAYKAMRVPPGFNRRFAAQNWECMDSEVWHRERTLLMEGVRRELNFSAMGWDIDEGAVDLTLTNAKKAKVITRVETAVGHLKDFVQPENATVICNPPYGERMLEIRQAEELYKIMGQVFPGTKSQPCYVISPHEDFERFFGRKATKRRKLYNGMLKCQLFMYY